MNRKKLYLNIAAVALLGVAGVAHAGKAVPLADAIRIQGERASANILADTRATLLEQTRTLDVPGVEVGPIRVVESEPAAEGNTQAALDIGLVELLREELALKALEAPGMFGVYRYVARHAPGVAIIVAE